jgi:predicted dehydrogenase
MPRKERIDRRRFLNVSAATAAFAIVPRRILGGVGYTAPNDRINVGYIGVGTQGIRQLLQALPEPRLRITAVCDPNRVSQDYIAWSRNEIRDKTRRFLKDPTWGEGIKGCRCGREVGREIVQAYYRTQGQPSDCAAYGDFRELLDKEKDLDALYIMTPDHLHATVALAAMKLGKHVIVHKPLSNIFHETKLVVETAKTAGVATHMFCSAASQSTMLLCEWIWSGAIGPVREVHNWSSRPFWPQGMTEYPAEEVPVPEGLDWDLWLGPVPQRKYHPALTHAVFRGWYEFGAGSLGDMGHYSFRQIFEVLKLGLPETVEASRSEYYAIVDRLWEKQENRVAYPRASTIRWEFPARGEMPPVALHWYDGGIRPPLPEELEIDGKSMPKEGLLFVGDEGKILAGFSGERPQLIPEKRMSGFKPPAETLARPEPELDQWVAACQGGKPSRANFELISPFCETICLGNVALRVPEKLRWDSKAKQFLNSSDANTLLQRQAYRQGWEL